MVDRHETVGDSVKNKKRNYGPALIILAGCFWGSMGIFVRRLGVYGFSSVQIVAIRVFLAALFFCILLFIKDRSGFRISLKDLPLFLGLGVGSAIWIMLMSVLFFHEKLTRKKLIALTFAFAGCIMVSGVSGKGLLLH